MSINLVQRLSHQGVSFVLESSGDGELSAAASRNVVAQRSAMLSYAASGGSRAPKVLLEIGEILRKLANEAGFPGDSSANAHSRFDRAATIYLGPLDDLATGEGLRDDVWSYIATVVVPDIVAWRFPERAAERFRGGVRNAIQRLWIRGAVLDRGEGHPQRWSLVEAMKEDAAVQIFERPGIFGQPTLAKALAEGYVETAAKTKQNMESIMRCATKIFRLRNEVYDLAGLPAEELRRIVTDCFEIASSNTR